MNTMYFGRVGLLDDFGMCRQTSTLPLNCVSNQNCMAYEQLSLLLLHGSF